MYIVVERYELEDYESVQAMFETYEAALIFIDHWKECEKLDEETHITRRIINIDNALILIDMKDKIDRYLYKKWGE